MFNLKLETYKWDAINCCGCKGCIWVDHVYASSVKYGMRCPSLYLNSFDSYSALGRNKLALGILEGSLDFSPKALDIIYKCTLCGACDAGCKRNLDLEPLLLLESLRVRAVEEGAGPPETQKRMAQNILSFGNKFGASTPKECEKIKSSSSKLSRNRVLFFPGCNSHFKNTHLMTASTQILDAINIDWQIFPGTACCGRPLLASGMASEALNIAKQNMEVMESTRCAVIVTACAECYKTWKVDYPKLMEKSTKEMNYSILHITELAAHAINEGKLAFRHAIPIKAAYHDSCNLGRNSEEWIQWRGKRSHFGILDPPKQYRRGTKGVYDAPRLILDSIPEFRRKELIRNRENTMCCGAGAGVLETYPDFAQLIAAHRLEEAMDLGVDAVISACPNCLDNFSHAIVMANLPIKAYDITEIMAWAITGRPVF